MIKSMTAYARAEQNGPGFGITTEIRSYNSRHLDIVLRLPHEHAQLEDKIKGLLSDRITRGRIEMHFQFQYEAQDAYRFEVNEPLARAYHQALGRLREQFRLEDDVTLEMLTQVNGIVKPAGIERDSRIYWPVVQGCVQTALDDLDRMRSREGNFIARDFERRLTFIEESVALIKDEARDLITQYQERLRERIGVLTNGCIEIDPGRIAQEAAFLADRSDISEEIVRAASHVQQFRTIMAGEKAPGRKLNFLLQELNREFNTMGAKAGRAGMAHTIVVVKSELEKLREQVQNIE